MDASPEALPACLPVAASVEEGDLVTPLKKARRDMKGSEVAADDAERAFEKSRKDVRVFRTTIKKESMEFLKIARNITKESKRYPSLINKRAKVFDVLMKKRIKDALSLKKENSYDLPLGWVTVAFKNVEQDLWHDIKSHLQGGEPAELAGQLPRDGCSAVDNAQAFINNSQVEKWNTKVSLDGDDTLTLDRLSCVRAWKKSNTKGGCFQMKKLNYIDGARVTYNRQSEVLIVRLCVQEGEPLDAGTQGADDDE